VAEVAADEPGIFSHAHPHATPAVVAAATVAG
jgi:hypothetical protein